MGLDSLHAQWHRLSLTSTHVRPRSLVTCASTGENGPEGVRNPLTRRLSDVPDCWSSLPATSSSRCPQQVSPAAPFKDGGRERNFPSSKCPSRTGSEVGFKSITSSSRTTDGALQALGFSRLVRWKSDGAKLMCRSMRFDGELPEQGWRWSKDTPAALHNGDDFTAMSSSIFEDGMSNLGREKGFLVQRWRTSLDSGTVIGDKTQSCPNFGMLDLGPNKIKKRESTDAPWCESQASYGTERALTSTVEWTAPSFVQDRCFAGRRKQTREEHRPSKAIGAVSVSIDRVAPSASDIATRPKSLKRKMLTDVTTDQPLGLGLHMERLSVPHCLRKLKRKRQAASLEGTCAMRKAFDSMVFMIRTLHGPIVHMRQVLRSDVDVQQLVAILNREMFSSFVWLFQQVFSCTPALMVSVMLLLANFTVFSLGNNVAVGSPLRGTDGPIELPSLKQTRAVNAQPLSDAYNGQSAFAFVRVNESSSPPAAPDIATSLGHGNGGLRIGIGGGPSVIVAGGEDGDHRSRIASGNAMLSEEFDPSELSYGSISSNRKPHLFPFSKNVSKRDRAGAAVEAEIRGESKNVYQSLLKQTAQELDLKPGRPHHYVQLDQETLRTLVAPVTVKMPSENYLCFDRTELEYQHAIDAEPANPMLLANYAQFLFVVRRDNSRAEKFFRRALEVDVADGDIWARWAGFLWLALKDCRRAETAYQAAIALDPTNPFHSGSYAHFLWHAGRNNRGFLDDQKHY